MTIEELLALPEITSSGEIGYVERTVDGKRVRFPVRLGSAGALWREESDPHGFIDNFGVRWDVGRVNGQMVRMKAATQ